MTITQEQIAEMVKRLRATWTEHYGYKQNAEVLINPAGHEAADMLEQLAAERDPDARTYADGYIQALDDALKKCVALRHSDDLESDREKVGAMHCALVISDMKQAAIQSAPC